MGYNGRIFLSLLLISACFYGFRAQTQPADTLKKPRADTLAKDDSELEEPVKYEAEDSTVALPQEGMAILYGKAQVEYGSMKMQAAVMEVDYNSNVVKAYGMTDSTGQRYGNPTFKDGGETMEADTIKYNLKTKKGKIYNALTRQGELLVVGNEIKKDSNDVIYMRNMKCIPCQEEDARTAFRAPKAKVIPDDKIVTGPMYLEIGGVPTPLGLPFGYFPNTKKQHNGILLPTVGSSPQWGFFLRDAGYYLGFNDKTDMIIRGTIWANGSWELGAENNYKVLYRHSGSTNISFSRFKEGEKEIPLDTNNHPLAFRTTGAYAIQWTHVQDNKSNPTMRFSADVNIRNNQQMNRLNSVNSAEFLQNSFQSNIAFTKSWRFGAVSLNAMHSQNSQTRTMDITLPSLTFNVNRFYPFRRKNAARQNVFDKIQANYLMQVTNALTTHEDSLFLIPLAARMRNGVKHTLPISTNFNILRYITATPQLNLSSVMYANTIRKEYVGEGVVTRTVNVPSAGYDASFGTAFNTQVYFDYLFKKGRMKQIRHLMIPTISYNYRPDYGEAHYGFWRDVQLDSTGRMSQYSVFERGIFQGPARGATNGLSFNLNNNVEGKFRTSSDTGVAFKKVTLLQNLSVRGGYNFAADSFRLSNFSVDGRTTLFRYIDVVASSLLSPYKLVMRPNLFGVPVPYDMDEYLWEGGNRYLRFVQGNIALSTSLGNDMIEALKNLRKPTDFSNAAEQGGEVRTDDAPEKLPWTLRVTYNLQLVNRDDRRVQPTHALNFSADMTPTKFWKVGVTSGFDFNTMQLSYTRVSIYRDLKCWEARIDWVPFGLAKSYSVSLNMKLSMLSEFKIPRQRQWYDQATQ